MILHVLLIVYFFIIPNIFLFMLLLLLHWRVIKNAMIKSPWLSLTMPPLPTFVTTLKQAFPSIDCYLLPLLCIGPCNLSSFINKFQPFYSLKNICFNVDEFQTLNGSCKNNLSNSCCWFSKVCHASSFGKWGRRCLNFNTNTWSSELNFFRHPCFHLPWWWVWVGGLMRDWPRPLLRHLLKNSNLVSLDNEEKKSNFIGIWLLRPESTALDPLMERRCRL